MANGYILYPMLPKILLGIGLFATVFSVLIFSGKVSFGDKKTVASGEVYVWGTLPDEAMTQLTQEFNPKIKTYAVRYKFVPESNFEQTLVEAIANGQGPDAILVPHQIILSQADRIMPFSIAEKTYRDFYVDGASVFLTSKGTLALPVSVEPMVLFYNRTLFSKHGIINPPTYWDEVVSLTPSLTVRQNGQFLESAIALGTPSVSYAKDILMAMVTQLGQVPVIKVANQAGEIYYSIQANEPTIDKPDVLPLVAVNRFFTQFGDGGQSAYTWPQSQTGDPADLFVGEKLAMYIGYSGEYQKLRDRNPRGDFQMTIFPQTRGYPTFSTGMRMYAFATLRSSKNPNASFAAESEFGGVAISPRIAAIAGGVPAFRSHAAALALDPVLARSMLVARGWDDRYSKQTTAYTTMMISDIINYRYGVNEATALFIARLRDLYTKKF